MGLFSSEFFSKTSVIEAYLIRAFQGRLNLDRAEAGLVLLQIILQGQKDFLRVRGGGDDAAAHLGLGHLRLQKYEVQDKLGLRMGDEGQVRVDPLGCGLVDLDLDLSLRGRGVLLAHKNLLI